MTLTTAWSMRCSVGADDLSCRRGGEPFWTLDAQAMLGLSNEFRWSPQGGVPLKFGQQILLDAHTRGSGARLVRAVDVLWDVADLNGCHSATVALKALICVPKKGGLRRR